MLSSLDFSRPSPMDGYYDVFLSFRGIDTRKGFTTNLYHALQDNEIHTFMDEDLVGEDIDHLFEVIAKSRMAVVVYSENFASSDWCLRELEMIMKHREDKKILVTPIFYKVDLKELKHLTGKTAQYLGQHKAAVSVYDWSSIELWKAAVTKLGGVSGISYKEIEYRSEYEFMKRVIAIIKKKLLTVCQQPIDEPSVESSQVKQQYPQSDPLAKQYTSSLNQVDDKDESDDENSAILIVSSRNVQTTENPPTTFDEAKVPDHINRIITSSGFSFVKPLTGVDDITPKNITTSNASSSGESSNGSKVTGVASNSQVMKLVVTCLTPFRHSVRLEVDPETTVGNIKAHFLKIWNSNVILLRLDYQGDELDDSRSLASYGIPNEGEVFICNIRTNNASSSRESSNGSGVTSTQNVASNSQVTKAHGTTIGNIKTQFKMMFGSRPTKIIAVRPYQK